MIKLTKFKRNLTIRGRVIDDLTIFSRERGIQGFTPQTAEDQIAPNVGEQTSIIADPNTLLLHRHIAPFRSEVGKKTSGVETRGQISPFLTPL